MIHFTCPHCSAAIEAPLGTEGHWSRCKCSRAVQVPLSPPADDVPFAMLADPPQAVRPGPAPRRSPATAPRATQTPPKRNYPVRWIVGAGVCLLVVVVALAAIALRPGGGGVAAMFEAPKPGPTRAKFARLRVRMTMEQAEAIMGQDWHIPFRGGFESIEASHSRIMAAAAAGREGAWANNSIWWNDEKTGEQLAIVTRGGLIAVVGR